MGKTPEYSPSMQSFIDEQTNLYGATAQKYGLNVDEARKSGRKITEWESASFGGDLEQIREVYGSPSEADIAFRLGQKRVSLGKQGLSSASQSEEALDFARQYVSGNIVSNNDKLMDFETQSKIYQHIDSVDSPEGLQKILAGEDSYINSLLAGTSTNGTASPISQQPTPSPQSKETPSHQPSAEERAAGGHVSQPQETPAPPKQNTTFFQGGAGQDIDQAIAQAAEENRKRAQQASNNQAAGAPTGQSGTAQPASGTPAANTSSLEPSAYAKAIKEENDRYTKETAGFDEKRKSLLRADGNQTEALKGLETERAVAARQHGINRIQNAMDAMQGTEAFNAMYEAEHLGHPNVTKSSFLTTGIHGFLSPRNKAPKDNELHKVRSGFIDNVSKELGLSAEETKELGTVSSTINQAYGNVQKQQAEIKSRYGESMKLVNSKDGLANMTTEQKIKHLGLSSRQVEQLNKNIPLTVQETMTDKLKSAWYSLTGGTAYGSKYHDLHRDIFKRAATEREQQIGQALDKMIMGRAQAGEWASKQTADRLAAIKRGDAAAIYDAAHAYDGPNANKTGALLREAPAAKAAAKAAAKKAAAETGGGSGIKWKGKVGAAAALLGLGAVFGTMMGHHGEQSNAQLYNPNPQPQYAN